MGGGGPHKSFVGRKDKGIEERNFTDAYISASARRKGPNQGARGVGEKGGGDSEGGAPGRQNPGADARPVVSSLRGFG